MPLARWLLQTKLEADKHVKEWERKRQRKIDLLEEKLKVPAALRCLLTCGRLLCVCMFVFLCV
jgi:hypothetical protein